jgi:hypothetical protein
MNIDPKEQRARDCSLVIAAVLILACMCIGLIVWYFISITPHQAEQCLIGCMQMTSGGG